MRRFAHATRGAVARLRGRTRAWARDLPRKHLPIVAAFIAGALLSLAIYDSHLIGTVVLLAVVLWWTVADDWPPAPSLEVLWNGGHLVVVEANIEPHMTVPTDGGPYGYDNFGGPIAKALFASAVRHGAIKIPEGLRIECYSDGEGGCRMMLAAFPTRGRAGVTTGWIDTTRIAVGCSEDTNEPASVLRGLRLMAAEVNKSLTSGF